MTDTYVPTTTGRVVFRSDDSRFAVELGASEHRFLLQLASAGGDGETGGILIGFYTEERNLAVITRVEPAPPDSRRGPTWFERGTKGLAQLLRVLWHGRRHYYLGEWHLHPHATAKASGEDKAQMLAIARSPSFHCPEPILLVVGGSPQGGWALRAYVFLRNGGVICLRKMSN